MKHKLLITRSVSAAILLIFVLLGGCLSESESEQTASDAAIVGGQNSPPTIEGSPPTAITIGLAYSFVPQASDPDGDALTFSISNMPSWASFDSNTGELSGDPTLAHVGSYGNIRISVSDGQDSTSLSSFSIEVTQSSLGAATLSLTAPTTNTDGTPFTDLAAFRVYFGTSSGSYPNRVSGISPGASTYVVENLAPATYYFVATAVNESGMESSFSNEVTRVVE